MSAAVAVRCHRCGEEFEPQSKRGRTPVYCSATCRQRAYEHRRIGRLVEERAAALATTNGRPATTDLVWGDVSLELDAGMSYDRWVEVGATLRQITRSIAWWVGDWVSHGEWLFGDRYAQAVDGQDAGKWLRYCAVASRIPPARRRVELSWTHHLIVAYLEPEEQERLLDLSVEEKLRTGELRARVKALFSSPPMRDETPEPVLDWSLPEHEPVEIMPGWREITVSALAAEYEEWQEAADARHVSVSQWLHDLAVEACQN
jgi:hypothetical protein